MKDEAEDEPLFHLCWLLLPLVPLLAPLLALLLVGLLVALLVALVALPLLALRLPSLAYVALLRRVERRVERRVDEILHVHVRDPAVEEAYVALLRRVDVALLRRARVDELAADTCTCRHRDADSS